MKIVSKMLMIGGQALVKLGSNRTTSDTDYLLNGRKTQNAFRDSSSLAVSFFQKRKAELIKEFETL